MRVSPAVLSLIFVCVSSSVRVIRKPALNCTQPGLKCKVNISQCMDLGWLKKYNYTPGSPEELKVDVVIREDVETGHLQPVLLASWKLRDEGSIMHLTATELHVLVKATNENVCVRYSFKEQLPMRNPEDEKWSFSADMLVLDPGEYQVSVFNIPKPELGYSSYNVFKDVVVPDCRNAEMRRTWFCIQRGSLWQPNTSMSREPGRSELTVTFAADGLCDEYIVIFACGTYGFKEPVNKGNQTTLTATFSLSKCPRHSCLYTVSLKPLFPLCGQDCVRHRSTLNTCYVAPTDKPGDVPAYAFIVPGVVVVVVACAAVVTIICIYCKRRGNHGNTTLSVFEEKPTHETQKEAPKVLVIYSQDHRLYRDVVLKLCAFLQAKCGTQVLVDLLDTTSVGLVGRLRWLEWQRQQMTNPSDKVLVLCSRGVQAKWRAMCGCERVMLREDVLSPTDDMLTPFLNLFLPDMHLAGMQGKYMVAYFEDICSEHDIPSVFEISVKYKLMKHFEDLYFRILDMEKYQPHQVNHIQGIGADEYFHCPSGAALRHAIETFRVYQVEHPDWFEKECVNSEEEVFTDAEQLLDVLNIPPVLECLPLMKDGLPILQNEVEISQKENMLQVVTPQIDLHGQQSSVAEIIVNPACDSNLERGLVNHLHPRSSCPTPTQAALAFIPAKHFVNHDVSSKVPVEDDETDFLLPVSQQLCPSDLTSSESNSPQLSCENMEYNPPPHEGEPEEMEELEILVPQKGLNSESDHGYQSRMSFQEEAYLGEDPLAALARLQEELFVKSFDPSDSE
ncbi:interleukin 17 receptor A1a [Neosynchiropus ocellatus]